MAKKHKKTLLEKYRTELAEVHGLQLLQNPEELTGSEIILGAMLLCNLTGHPADAATVAEEGLEIKRRAKNELH